MTSPAADDFDFIRKRLRRINIEQELAKADIKTGTIPDSILLSAGFTAAEISALGNQKILPLNETDLMH